MDVDMRILKRKSEPSHTGGFVNSLPLPAACCSDMGLHLPKFSTNSAPAVILAMLQETDSLALHFKAALPWNRNFSLFFLFKTGYL